MLTSKHLTKTFPNAQTGGLDCVADAMERLSASRLPAVALLDIELSGRNGLNLPRAIKQERPEIGACLGMRTS